MEFDVAEALRRLLLAAPPFILSLSFHEFAHAWSANKLGDSTARYLGRMTMDPKSHIDLWGTIIIPSIGLFIGGFVFGWANPVPVDPRNFKKPIQHMAIVAAAGPASNFILAILCTFLLSTVASSGVEQVLPLNSRTGLAGAAIQMLNFAVWINLLLCFFNLLPVPPLDGSRIVKVFLSPSAAARLDSWAPQMSMIFLILIFTGVFRYLMYPVAILRAMLFHVFDVPIA